jgi:hypothetical protein
MFELKIPFVIDPRTKEPSVSLSLLLTSFVLIVVGVICELTKLTESTSILMELFYANAALYFGRKFQGKSGNNLETASKEEK